MSTGITTQGGTDRLNRILKLYHSRATQILRITGGDPLARIMVNNAFALPVQGILSAIGILRQLNYFSGLSPFSSWTSLALTTIGFRPLADEEQRQYSTSVLTSHSNVRYRPSHTLGERFLGEWEVQIIAA